MCLFFYSTLCFYLCCFTLGSATTVSYGRNSIRLCIRGPDSQTRLTTFYLCDLEEFICKMEANFDYS